MRSTYFEALFANDMSEAGSRKVRVPDTEAKHFKVLLEWLYSGQAQFSDNMAACAVLRLADKYALRELADWCAIYLERRFAAEDVVTVWKVAKECNMHELEQDSFHFIMEHLDACRETAPFQESLADPQFARAIVGAVASPVPQGNKRHRRA